MRGCRGARNLIESMTKTESEEKLEKSNLLRQLKAAQISFLS
jgi:hypothetical protein